MRTVWHRKSWSPYAVGAGIGVLSWFAFATADQPLGVTTPFEHTAALGENALLPEPLRPQTYNAARAAEGQTPRIGWEWMLVLGIFLGAFASSVLSGDRGARPVSPLWSEHFGAGGTKRFLAAFGGGVVMILGARLARGCTSGHGISGTLQLAVSSWIFIIVAFAAAVGVAHLLYGSGGRDDVRRTA